MRFNGAAQPMFNEDSSAARHRFIKKTKRPSLTKRLATPDLYHQLYASEYMLVFVWRIYPTMMEWRLLWISSRSGARFSETARWSNRTAVSPFIAWRVLEGETSVEKASFLMKIYIVCIQGYSGTFPTPARLKRIVLGEIKRSLSGPFGTIAVPKEAK